MEGLISARLIFGVMLLLALVPTDTRPRMFIDQRGDDAAGRAFVLAVRARVLQQGVYRLAAMRGDADLIVQMQTMALPCDQTTSIVGAQFLRPGASLAFVGSLLVNVPLGKVATAADATVHELAALAKP